MLLIYIKSLYTDRKFNGNSKFEIKTQIHHCHLDFCGEKQVNLTHHRWKKNKTLAKIAEWRRESLKKKNILRVIEPISREK